MGTKTKTTKTFRRSWSKQDVQRLRQGARSKTPAMTLARQLGRTQGATRQKAHALGISMNSTQGKKRTGTRG